MAARPDRAPRRRRGHRWPPLRALLPPSAPLPCVECSQITRLAPASRWTPWTPTANYGRTGRLRAPSCARWMPAWRATDDVLRARYDPLPVCTGGLDSRTSAAARRFEALVFDWDHGDTSPARDTAHLGAAIEEACAHGLDVAIVSALVVGELDAQLGARPVGPGGLILATRRGREVFSVDRDGFKRALETAARISGDVERGAFEMTSGERRVIPWLWQCGIAPEQVLIAGGKGFDGRGAPRSDQSPARGRAPDRLGDPLWTVVIEGIDRALERAHESLLTVADGTLGTRGSVIVAHSAGDPAVLMSGIYARAGSESHLLAAPRWHAVAVGDDVRGPIRRSLDLRAGVLRQEIGSGDGPIEVLLFSSWPDPGSPCSAPEGRCVDRPSQGRSSRRLASRTSKASATVRHGCGRGAGGVDRRSTSRAGAWSPPGEAARPGRRLRGRKHRPADQSRALTSSRSAEDRLRCAAGRAPASVGLPVGGRGRPDRGRSGAPARNPPGPVSPDGAALAMRTRPRSAHAA